MHTVVKLEHVSKVYKDKAAVNDISLEIQSGSITALLGPNGAGKTTTISMMLGLLKSTSGSIAVFGKKPHHIQVREQIGAMLQEVRVLDGLKVGELIDLFRSYYAKPLSKAELLRLSGLAEEQKKPTSKLSGGQKRRLGFALAMAGNPKLLFLDEPTVGMDVASRRLFWSTLKGLTEEGTTILFTSHDLQEVEDLADRIILMNKGVVIADGSPAEVKSQLTVSSVSFIVDHYDSIAGILRSLPSAEAVQYIGDRVVIKTSNSDRIVYALFEHGIRFRSLQISQGRLDDAYLELTKNEEVAAG